jgi:hypothetical protein
MRALRLWSRRLREVFEADTVAGKPERTDALLIAADCRPRLVSHGPGLPFHLHYAPVRSGLTARVKALTAAGLAHIIDNGEGSRLRTCSRSGPAAHGNTDSGDAGSEREPSVEVHPSGPTAP